MNQNNMR